MSHSSDAGSVCVPRASERHHHDWRSVCLAPARNRRRNARRVLGRRKTTVSFWGRGRVIELADRTRRGHERRPEIRRDVTQAEEIQSDMQRRGKGGVSDERAGRLGWRAADEQHGKEQGVSFHSLDTRCRVRSLKRCWCFDVLRVDSLVTACPPSEQKSDHFGCCCKVHTGGVALLLRLHSPRGPPCPRQNPQMICSTRAQPPTSSWARPAPSSSP